MMTNFNEIKNENIENYIINHNGLYDNLNKVVGGYNTGELVVLAARPACGKTTLAFNLACCASNVGKTLFFSLEMSHKELWDRAEKFIDDTYNLNNLYVETNTCIGLDDIESNIIEYKPKFVFIDYLNIMQKDNIRVRTTRLKAMAKKYNCVIFVLAQLNRKANKTTPDLTMLKDTGNIEQDATQVYFLTKTKLIIAKNRKGKVGDIPIIYDFENSIIYENIDKINNWKKCVELYNKWSVCDWFNKKLIEKKIKNIDMEFYNDYMVSDYEAPVEFIMMIGGK